MARPKHTSDPFTGRWTPGQEFTFAEVSAMDWNKYQADEHELAERTAITVVSERGYISGRRIA